MTKRSTRTPWKQIDDAPQDGRMVLLYVVTPIEEDGGDYYVGRFDKRMGWVTEAPKGTMVPLAPSYWMDLPEAPKVDL